jgi:hypothetical protein
MYSGRGSAGGGGGDGSLGVVSSASDVLAAQLRSPGFRTAPSGYDPDHVRDHLAAVHGIFSTLERRVHDLTREVVAAEAAAARAEAAAPAPPAAEDDELLAVVFEGQRRADQVLAEAEAEAARLAREADARIADLRDDSEVRRLRDAVEVARARWSELDAAAEQGRDDLRTVAEATRRARSLLRERLDAALRDITLMATSRATERT